MTNTLIRCPYCRTLHTDNHQRCVICQESLIVATLTCVRQIGDQTQSGSSWVLQPKNYAIGRAQNNDIVIDHPMRFKLIYSEGDFYLKEIPKEFEAEKPVAKKLRNGTPVNLGDGQLKISYIANLDKYSKHTSDGFKTALSTSCFIHRLNNPSEIRRAYLDAVLEITGLEKALIFSVKDKEDSKEPTLAVLMARSKKREDMDCRAYPVSRECLNKTLNSHGNIIIIDTETTTNVSESAKRFDLKSIICCPMFGENGKLKEIMYADSIAQRIKRESLFYCKTVLKLLSELTEKRLSELGD